MWALLTSFSWQELRHHPWRHSAALLAVTLGVALAYAVHLINVSALEEFSQAARKLSGQGDLQLRAGRGYVDETWFRKIATTPGVELAVPVLDLNTYLMLGAERKALRVLGVDLLSVWQITPQLSPIRLEADGLRGGAWSLLSPGQVFLSPTAWGLRRKAQDSNVPSDRAQLQVGSGLAELAIAGRIAISGPATAVMDIGAAQDLFGLQGKLSRIDIKLTPSMSRERFASLLQERPDWSPQLQIESSQDGEARLQNLSRAYRVNLTVLALIALFTGAFLVFSVLSLSVTKRAQQFALLGVLGLGAQDRLRLVLAESLVLGAVGSASGLLLGAALARVGLDTLGADLGGGFFGGDVANLQISVESAVLYGAAGLGAALLGGWWPARQAAQLPPAQTLKGLEAQVDAKSHASFSLACLVAAAALSQAPPFWGIPLAAYSSVALLLIGGISALPWLVAVSWRSSTRLNRHTLLLLAVERARRQRHSAAVAVGSVVASLSLAVALTVMVTSFRESVAQWLHQVLPADLYLRSARSVGASDTVYFSQGFVDAARQIPGVRELQAQRQQSVQLDPQLPALTLLIKPLRNPQRDLPLLGAPLQATAQTWPVYVSEAVIDLYKLKPGDEWPALARALRSQANQTDAQTPRYVVAGVWRDYARQSGSAILDEVHYPLWQQDRRANDLGIWLQDPKDMQAVQAHLRDLMNREQAGAGSLLDFGTAQEIRAASLNIFDRSFAVTYWLQSVAIAIGLFGVAASFSAQVFARRKEFGLLSHLGLTRRQILTLVALEGAVWTLLGAAAGLILGLLVAWVLVDVVNPQSFHWTMDLIWPWSRLLPLLAAVVLSGTLTAWLAGRAAASRDAVMAVKEDW